MPTLEEINTVTAWFRDTFDMMPRALFVDMNGILKEEYANCFELIASPYNECGECGYYEISKVDNDNPLHRKYRCGYCGESYSKSEYESLPRKNPVYTLGAQTIMFWCIESNIKGGEEKLVKAAGDIGFYVYEINHDYMDGMLFVLDGCERSSYFVRLYNKMTGNNVDENSISL